MQVRKVQTYQGSTMQVSKAWEVHISEILARSYQSTGIGLYRLPVVGGIL